MLVELVKITVHPQRIKVSFRFLTFRGAQDKYLFPNFETNGISDRQRNLHL